MAVYKVPQDVEADDKLLGPFSFRQFVYLMIVFGLLLLAIGLFQLFPLLAIIPVPFMVFFGALALPLKKDQPMETYLAAVVSFHTKPNKRYWMPGQSESTIQIIAPKIVEEHRARNLSGDEASHRLSFLAELVDSEGNAIKGASTAMKDEFYAEAYNTTDMFDANSNFRYGSNGLTTEQQEERRAEIIDSMRDTIQTSEYNTEAAAAYQRPGQRVIQPHENPNFTSYGAPLTASGYDSPNVVQPIYTPENPIPTDQDYNNYNNGTYTSY